MDLEEERWFLHDHELYIDDTHEFAILIYLLANAAGVPEEYLLNYEIDISRAFQEEIMNNSTRW